MSYDFAARIDTGGPDAHFIEPFFDDVHPAFGSDGMAGNVMMTATGYARCGNYTSNVRGMWAKCLTAAAQQLGKPYTDWQGDDPILTLRGLAGKRLGDLAALLAAAVEWGVEHIDVLSEDNPANGWGNAEGAVTYLWDIQRFCEQHPNADLYISL